MAKKKDYICVIKIKEGVVDECSLHTNVKDAEEEFTLAALDIGANKKFMNTHLDDGYCISNDRSVCLVHPTLKIRS